MSAAREQILQATCALLEKQGYHGTGLNEIVKESGAPKGSLYHYFPEGKEQIVSEALLHASRLTAKRIRSGLAASSNLAKAVYEFVLKIAENVETSNFSSGSPLTAVAMETATKSEKINQTCREAYEMLQVPFREKLLGCGYSKNKAEELSAFMIAAIEGGIILSRTYHTADPLRLAAKQLKVLLT